MAGKVKVEVYPNSTLVGDADEMQALFDNKVQLLAPSMSKFAPYTKKLQVFDLPFLFDDAEALQRFQKRESARQLLRSMADHGVYGLAYWNNGLKQLGHGAAAQAERCGGAGLPYPALAGARGAVRGGRCQVGGAAVRQGLRVAQGRRGAGAENPWSNILSQNMHSVQPYITETNHGVLDYMLITNNEFWLSMPFAVRSELEGIILEVTQAVNREAAAVNRRDRDRILASGSSQLITLTPEERQAWREQMLPVWKTYEAEIGADLIRAAMTVNRRR